MPNLYDTLLIRSLTAGEAKKAQEQEQIQSFLDRLGQATQQILSTQKEEREARKADFGQRLAEARIFGEQAKALGRPAPEFSGEMALRLGEAAQMGAATREISQEDLLRKLLSERESKRLEALERLGLEQFKKVPYAAPYTTLGESEAREQVLAMQQPGESLEQTAVRVEGTPEFKAGVAERQLRPQRVEQVTGQLRTEAGRKLVYTNEVQDIIDRLKSKAGASPETPATDIDWTEFVGKWPGLKGKTLNFVESWVLSPFGKALPAEAQEDLQSIAGFASVVQRYRSREFHDLLGAAQTAIEMKTLADSIIEMDMGSTKFGAVLAELEEKNRQIARAWQVVTTQNPELPLGSKEFGLAIDAEVYQAKQEDEQRAQSLLKALERTRAGPTQLE